jgi:hypothetical protein
MQKWRIIRHFFILGAERETEGTPLPACPAATS